MRDLERGIGGNMQHSVTTKNGSSPRKRGNRVRLGPFNRPLKERFWNKVKKSDAADGCWLWTGHLSASGYGSFHAWPGTRMQAHRASYSLNVAPIPAGMLVCHRCDVRACVRPDHLFLGTGRDNTRDMMTKGRARFAGKPASRPANDTVRGQLSLVHGGLYVHRELTPEQWLERGFREICARCKVLKPSGTLGGYATPAVAATAQGLRFPLRLIARIITGVLVAGGPVEFGEELGHLIITFNAQEVARLNRRPPTRGGQRSAA